MKTAAFVVAILLTAVAAAAEPGDDEVIHADLYFDFGSARLRADAARVLEEQAVLMDVSGVWAVLVYGYTDRREPDGCHEILAWQRAEAAKRFLVHRGVDERSVKVVAVGPEGSLCDEPRRECTQFDRRVHLEMRRLGDVVATTPSASLVER